MLKNSQHKWTILKLTNLKILLLLKSVFAFILVMEQIRKKLKLNPYVLPYLKINVRGNKRFKCEN